MALGSGSPVVQGGSDEVVQLCGITSASAGHLISGGQVGPKCPLLDHTGGQTTITLYDYARVSVREPEDKNLDLVVKGNTLVVTHIDRLSRDWLMGSR